MPLTSAVLAALLALLAPFKAGIAHVQKSQVHRRHVRHVRRARRRRRPVGLRIVRLARRYLGVPYVYGGSTPHGFDCSGLVRWVIHYAAGPWLPHYSYAQLRIGQPVRHLRQGDVVFTRGGDHEGIYAGHGEVIHAPHTGDRVRYTTLAYFREAGWAGARRYR